MQNSVIFNIDTRTSSVTSSPYPIVAQISMPNHFYSRNSRVQRSKEREHLDNETMNVVILFHK